MVQFTRSSLPAAVSRKTSGSPQASGQRDPPRARPGPRATPALRGLRGDRHSRLLGHVFCTDLGLAPQSRLLAEPRRGGSMPRALGPPVPPGRLGFSVLPGGEPAGSFSKPRLRRTDFTPALPAAPPARGGRVFTWAHRAAALAPNGGVATQSSCRGR